jgi:hypothetical protein
MSSTSPHRPRRAPSAHKREAIGGVTKTTSSPVRRTVWCQAAHMNNLRPSTPHILHMEAQQSAPTSSGRLRLPHPRLALRSLLEVYHSMAWITFGISIRRALSRKPWAMDSTRARSATIPKSLSHCLSSPRTNRASSFFYEVPGSLYVFLLSTN